MTFRTFTFMFGFGNFLSHKMALLLALIFVAGLVALLAERARAGRLTVLLIVSPFILGFIGACAHLFPFAGTQHQMYLLPFFAAGLSAAFTWVSRKAALVVLLLGIVVAPVWAKLNLTPDPAESTIDNDPRVFPIGNMYAALDAIHRDVPAGAPLFVDGEKRGLSSRITLAVTMRAWIRGSALQMTPRSSRATASLPLRNTNGSFL